MGEYSWQTSAGAALLLVCLQGCSPSGQAPAESDDRPEQRPPPASAAAVEGSTEICKSPSGSAFLAQESVREEIASVQQLATAERLQGPLPDSVNGIYAEARGVGARLADRFPNAADAHEVSARIELATGHTEMAQARWQRALEINPDYPYAHHGLGMVFDKLGDYEQALKQHLLALEQAPELAEAVHRAAELLITLGRADEAIELLRRHLADQPHDLEARYRIAQAYLHQGEYEAAKSAYAMILDHDETIPRALYGLSVALARLGETEQAEAAMQAHQRLITAEEEADFQSRHEGDYDYREQSRRMAAYYLDAARVYLGNQEIQQAALLCERSLQLDSSPATGRTLLASIYQQTGRPADAIRLYQQATEDQPEAVDNWLQLGWLLAQAGNTADAEQALREAIRREPDSDRAQAALAQLYLQFMNRPDEAAARALKAVELLPQASHWGLLSQALAAQGRLDEAEQAASQAVSSDPQNPVWRKLLAAIRRASPQAKE